MMMDEGWMGWGMDGWMMRDGGWMDGWLMIDDSDSDLLQACVVVSVNTSTSVKLAIKYGAAVRPVSLTDSETNISLLSIT